MIEALPLAHSISFNLHPYYLIDSSFMHNYQLLLYIQRQSVLISTHDQSSVTFSSPYCPLLSQSTSVKSCCAGLHTKINQVPFLGFLSLAGDRTPSSQLCTSPLDIEKGALSSVAVAQKGMAWSQCVNK